jgi:hypothetical protein
MIKILRHVQNPPNTEGRPEGLTERPSGQLQLPFQNSAESFPYQDLVWTCCPRVRTVTFVIPFCISKRKLESSGNTKGHPEGIARTSERLQNTFPICVFSEIRNT